MPRPRSVGEAKRFFSKPVNCVDYFISRRWPNGIRCQSCGSTSVYYDSGRNTWECKNRHPKRRFSIKTGTIFEDSPLGLDKWLLTIWMFANRDVGSHELARTIGVTQKTAWLMLQRIKLALQDPEDESGPG